MINTKENFYYNSPIGIFEFQIYENKLISLKPSEKIGLSSKENELSKKIRHQLDEYFSNKRKYFDIPILLKGTPFQKNVWEELKKIPYGKTSNYQEIANKINNKNAQRAVGNSCNKNPILIIIPCHRVIPKSAKLGGFAYNNKIKEFLLNLESKTC